tara:strand:- start:236 stop:553 length:318 start_codon:yes stop_codon:yes gene_type:complete
MSEEENQVSQTRDFVDSLASGNNAKAGEAFKGALRDRVGDTLDAKRKEHASNLFSTAQPVPTEAQDFSDPKPEVADPGTIEKDGTVSPHSTDGKAQIDLTTDEDK